MSNTPDFHPDEYRHYEAVLAAARQSDLQLGHSVGRRSLNEAFMLLLSQSSH